MSMPIHLFNCHLESRVSLVLEVCFLSTVKCVYAASMLESPNFPAFIFLYQAKVNTNARGCHEVLRKAYYIICPIIVKVT